MVRNDVLCHVKPELGHLSQHSALLRHLIVQNHIEAADPVGSHHNEAVAIIIDLPNLAFLDGFIVGHSIYPALSQYSDLPLAL